MVMHVCGYVPYIRLFTRKVIFATCQNPFETEMLTEEKFAMCVMALIMIMFAISSPSAYNHILSDVYTCVVFNIL